MTLCQLLKTEEEKAQRRGRTPGLNKVNDQARSIDSLLEERVAIPANVIPFIITLYSCMLLILFFISFWLQYDLRNTTCGQKMAVKDQGQVRYRTKAIREW